MSHEQLVKRNIHLPNPPRISDIEIRDSKFNI
jgi:hypothetical protein